MKTNILKLTAILLMLVGFSACEKETQAVPLIAECGKYYISETEFFSWCVVPYVVSENSENMQVLENRTEIGLTYGNPFSLEYFNGSNWENIPLDGVNWTNIELGLFPDKTTEEYIYLYSLIKKYNNAKKGKYRLIRRYSMHNLFFHTGVQIYIMGSYIETITLYAEFIVK